MRGICKVIVITCDDDAWTTSVARGLMGRHRTHVAAGQVLIHRGSVIYSLVLAGHKEHENSRKSRGVNREHSTARDTMYMWNNMSMRDDARGWRDVARQTL